MAKNFIKPRKHETGRTITTKTPYGTTSDMLVTDENILSKVECPENFVLVKDADGYYITQKSRLDSGLADPNRYDISYRNSVRSKFLSSIIECDDNKT
jgi:hypothetical protein